MRTVEQAGPVKGPVSGQKVVPRQGRSDAVRKVLQRRSYASQTELLRVGAANPAPGEEADLARAGFASPARELPHRGEMEQAFGQQLGHVKAHTGPEASMASDAMGAEAYAVGSSIAFDRENPSRETVAHEVAHVVQTQQGYAPARGSDKSVEREADDAAKVAAQGGKVGPLGPAAPAVRKKEKLPSGKEGFKKMWDAHPHNYLPDASQNTSSPDLLESIGLPTDWNTCAIRLSVMLNKIGLTITPAKVKAAGIARAPYYSKKTKQYYILSAKEMWTYLSKNFRKADIIFPSAQGVYKNSEEFTNAFKTSIEPIVKSRKGIVAFEKIFGYSGSGHVDLFDGLQLSDAPDWYPSMRVHLWYVVVPDEGTLQ